MKLRFGNQWLLPLLAFLALFVGAIASGSRSAHAATGNLVGSVTFAADCSSGLGVGITFDGTNLWFSCVGSATDLYKASPTTGAILGSFSVKGGLGALAWDNSRGKLWAGAGCGPGQGGGEIYLIDPVTGVGTLQFTLAGAGNCLDDGLAYDGGNDSIYWSWDGSTVIRHVSSAGISLPDDGFPWGGNACYNSGLAIGGSLLYQGSDGCSHVWVVDKTTKAAAFDFSTVTPGDPNFRDEGLTCDNVTFKSSGKEVMWSKEAYSPNRAHAFEIPSGSCAFGGGAKGPDLTITKDPKPGQPAPVPGGYYSFIIRVKNAGNAATPPPPRDVFVRDDLSLMGTFVFWTASAGVCTNNAPFVDCSRGSMAPGEEWWIEIRVRLPGNACQVTDRAVVDPFNRIPETNELNNSATLTVAIPRPGC